MATVKKPGKDGKTGWYSVVRGPDGRQIWEYGGPRKKDAEALELRRKQQKLDGALTLKDKGLADFGSQDFLPYKKPRLRTRTFSGYEQDIKVHQAQFFGNKKLRKITVDDVNRFVAWLSAKGLSPRTINKQLALLCLIFDLAITLGYCRTNPARQVDRLREARKEMQFLNPDEIRRFLAAVPKEYYVLFLLALLTGLRQGEILALRWSDFDEFRGLLFVLRTFHPEVGFAEPKTAASRRAVHVTPVLLNALVEYRVETNGRPEDLIFRNRAGGPISHQNLASRVFHPALERSGVKRVRFHDLRHSYACLMISMGVNIKFLQQQLGHASIVTTLDQYGHLLTEVADGVGSRLDALVFEEDFMIDALSTRQGR